MQLKTVTAIKWFRPVIGAALATLCGLLLWGTSLGDAWVDASYDYQLRFGSRVVTNQVVLIQMDNEAYDHYGRTRDQPWDRALHAQLLNHLTDDGCDLVVFDVFFDTIGDTAKDAALAAAMRRQGRVALMAGQADRHDKEDYDSARPLLPVEPFLSAVKNNWGVAWLDPDLDAVVRRHWPFPAPGPYESLAWTAARLMGARLPETPQEQWLRYYDRDVSLKRLSYDSAFGQPTNFFRGAIVFIGNKPATTFPNDEKDKFRMPHTRWTGEAVGGMEIQATEFLNLMNGDWLRRPAEWVEVLLLVVTGILFGGGMSLMRRRIAGVTAVALALVVTLGFVSWSYYTNFWFPWFVIAGGQVPCALAWALLTPKPQTEWTERFPGYAPVFTEPFGEGAYGKVWLVRNALGQLQALKEIERAKFSDREPYDREFSGIKNYKPISNQHLGLLYIDHVNRNERKDYFYYVMELGDALDPDWQKKNESYRPCVLNSVCSQADGGRLPARECVRIGIALLEALEFLHQRDLVHRDIKPSNIIFVQGRPKFADVGLVREVSGDGQDVTQVFTEYYRAPDGVGTKSADIYAMGMTLYVIGTGMHPRSFSELSTTLVAKPEFMRLNEIICQACQPASAQRYTTAAQMLAALREAQRELDADQPGKI